MTHMQKEINVRSEAINTIARSMLDGSVTIAADKESSFQRALAMMIYENDQSRKRQEEAFMQMPWLKKMSVKLDLSNLVRVYESIRSAYFWKPPMTAYARRALEEEYTVPKITWEEGGHSYSAEIATTVSCNHVYVYKAFYKDGERTNWTAIINSIQRLNKEYGGNIYDLFTDRS